MVSIPHSRVISQSFVHLSRQIVATGFILSHIRSSSTLSVQAFAPRLGSVSRAPSSTVSTASTASIVSTVPKATATVAATFAATASQHRCLSTLLHQTMPSPPYKYCTDDAVLDLTALGQECAETEQKRQETFDVARKIEQGIVKAKLKIEMRQPTTDIDAELASIVASVVPDGSGADRMPRKANLSSRIEDYVRYKSFQHFLLHGALLPPSQATYATDEEYLAGACMGLCHDLGRYGMGRATARDFDSVVQTTNLVKQLLDYFLKFNFRNGPLRRRYDSTKYALKNLETILYELSITGCAAKESGDDDVDASEPSSKRQKADTAMPDDELEAIRQRVEARDEKREVLIKKCRDGQKAAKQAIYALHRGDLAKAEKLISTCETCIHNDLLPIVNEEPPLRNGSFANVLEEYVEAKLFQVWLCGQPGEGKSLADTPASDMPSCIILGKDDFGNVPIEPVDYIGGICDLTGEIGRYAVQRGTARDMESVRKCLTANSSVHVAIQSMARAPNIVHKKSDQLRRSIEKLERMLYEMSLSEAAGGRAVQSEEHTEDDK